MIAPHELQKSLCSAFCTAISVTPVPSGYAVSSVFTDQSGDRIGFYVVPDSDGYRIEDDGEYLSHLVGSGVDIDHGTRAQLLDAILKQSGAFWDRDSFEIRTNPFNEKDLVSNVADFISALIRVRDLALLTRDVVRSTFRDDALAALKERFAQVANVNEKDVIDLDLSEFPVDVVLRPFDLQLVTIAVYFVTANEHLSEALLLHQEAERLRRRDFAVVALLEEPEMKTISRKKFQRAQNRFLTMPIFRGDEKQALSVIARKLEQKKIA